MCFPLTIRLALLAFRSANGMAKRKEGKGVQVPVPADTPPKGTGPEETLRAALAEETESDPWEKEDPWSAGARSREEEEQEPRSRPVSYGPGAFSYEQGGAPGLPPPCESSVFPPKSPSTWPGQQPGVWPGYPSPLPGGDWVLPGYPLGGFGVPDMMWWMQFMSQLKGSGKGYSEPWKTESRDQGPEEQRGGEERSNKKKEVRSKETEKKHHRGHGKGQGDKEEESERSHQAPPRGGGGPPGGAGGSSGGDSGGSSSGHTSDVSSTVNTSELRSLVRGRGQGNPRQTQSITGIGEDRRVLWRSHEVFEVEEGGAGTGGPVPFGGG